SLKPFRLALEARPEEKDGRPAAFPAAGGTQHPSAVLRLPRPRGTRDRGEHRVVVVIPDGDLRVPQPPNPSLELVSQEAHRVEWRAERFPAQVAVAWRPYRPEVRAESVADVTLRPGRVEVSQRLRLAFPESD